ncbi:uncharacterized protein LOC108961014 [Eucalyptus grandis]|uniref:Uncharacterized protein n=2 Tax=Eucalyptus grandis TaxID=71139 RepID=A0ACC3K8R0_EUCGR|nr:uncharacterized protein LOC108961014 [Eucalyptus grandis]XP_039172815.1 uncharacterized protein LOC108961014 [Eucalyptus grandis]XP_039172816.1 uncharacterized protein LOC108961014 [Eucalyptus grandis]XP_039172817.1 uncharacterized protein LOC108961014 [Eucalyptus grandis]XP_039172818.1 uncharacterized protein LOC108961014 [Eucalyptus grandis]XP_039172819.1 uncharacterized protein LOC108961014 [Eucalyptus grandis]XP_039172820.1 uncharacterized protein LOC108961014 [Eucalyptus grandis]XP_0
MGNSPSSSKKKGSDGKQKGKSMRKPMNIRGHEHRLIYQEQEKSGSEYQCEGCQQPGFGPYYLCEEGCNLHYHPCCSKLLSSDPSESSSAAAVGNHHPYPTGDLVLKERAPRKARCCVACGEEVRMLRYKWRHKKAHGSRNPYWRLYYHLNYRAFHPLCASLPASLPVQIEETGEHEIVLQLKERIQGECLICKRNAKGWAYNCTSKKYSCHVWCMKKEIIERLQQEEASRESKVTIYVKKALRQILVKLAFRLIIEAFFAFL